MKEIWFRKPKVVEEMTTLMADLLSKGEAGSLVLIGRAAGNEALMIDDGLGKWTVPVVPMPLPLEYQRRKRKGWVAL